MADTVDLDKLTEYRDSPHDVESKLDQLADHFRASKHIYFFTGAGLSTSAKIPDFRGPDGVWTRQAQHREAPQGVDLEQALPTSAHMAIAELIQRGEAKYVVSQNIDGLHRRSGIPPNKISELHGNCYLELCWGCGHENLYTFDVSARSGRRGIGCPECRKRVPHHCHCTARSCTQCGGRMKDSIIHFGENLPIDALGKAVATGNDGDLCIVLGSSLTVRPACDVPKNTAKKGGKVAIVNLQETPLDEKATLKIHAKTDEVMEGLMKRLKIPIPAWEDSAAAKAEAERKAAYAAEKKARKAAGKKGEDDGAAAAGEGNDPHSNGPASAATGGAGAGPAGREGGAAAGAAAGGGAGTALANRLVKLALRDDEGGYVQPKRNCPHVAENCGAPPPIAAARALFTSPCATCADITENWCCEKCQTVACSRYVKAHMGDHAETSGHLIATSLRDLNTWCYACESYIVSPLLRASRDTLYLAKHGELPPHGAPDY